ncbi:hypothetical protein [Mycobacterium sp.]|uniref:hypothetical protein n=1 Tax=Mycobacterium sp. TaxID=1785 RepID=UPI003D131439
MGSSMDWIRDRWHEVAGAGSTTWLAWAVWALLALGVAGLIFANAQIRRNRRQASEESRPHVGMFMEPHAADWHVIELVVRNFGKTSAYDVSFTFPQPPTVAEYENATDGYADVIELQLPRHLPVLAPGQEWRTVWDSALDRTELGAGIESRFPGTVTYYDRIEIPRGWKFWQRRRRALETKVVLDWASLPPVQRIELMTNHDLAKREKQKLELLRSLLTYFHYATKETRVDVFRAEIERINRAVDETKDRWRTRQIEAPPTDVSLRWGNAEEELGKHRGERV